MKRGLKEALGRLPLPLRRTLCSSVIPSLRAYLRYVPVDIGKDALWKNLASKLWWPEEKVEARTAFGEILRVDATDFVGRYIYYFGAWEPNLTAWLQRSLKRGDVFVDVGANTGYFSLLASRLVAPEGHVVAVEALPQIHRQLQENLAANGIVNVRAVCVAAWDVNGSVEMFTAAPAGPSAVTTAYRAWAERWNLVPAMQVAAKPLSAILEADEIRRARVIKIDAEGAEWRIIKGLEAVLSRCRDELAIVVEMTPELLRKENSSPEDLARLLRNYGFYPYRIENAYEASAYYRGCVQPPVQLNEFPSDTEQLDIIFSRVSAPHL